MGDSGVSVGGSSVRGSSVVSGRSRRTSTSSFYDPPTPNYDSLSLASAPDNDLQHLVHTSAVDLVTRDLYQVVVRTASNVNFVITLFLSYVLLVTHLEDPLAGFFGPFLRKYMGNHLVAWALKNFSKFCGLTIILPVIVGSRTLHSYISLCIVTSIVVLPAYPIWYYSIIAIAMHLFVHVRSAFSRNVILCAIAGYTLYSYELIRDFVPVDKLTSALPS